MPPTGQPPCYHRVRGKWDQGASRVLTGWRPLRWPLVGRCLFVPAGGRPATRHCLGAETGPGSRTLPSCLPVSTLQMAQLWECQSSLCWGALPWGARKLSPNPGEDVRQGGGPREQEWGAGFWPPDPPSSVQHGTRPLGPPFDPPVNMPHVKETCPALGMGRLQEGPSSCVPGCSRTVGNFQSPVLWSSLARPVVL